MISRRGVLAGGAGIIGLGVVGAAGWELAPYRVKESLGLTPDPFIPDAPEGQVRLETVSSAAMGADVDLFTAVPEGYGDGAGLPVVVILHGSSASAAEFRDFGFGHFLTAAVQAGAAPFVLAGTDDGPAGWVPDGSGADPQAMLTEEMPRWLGERGFDADRRVLWGWSRGGYGVLRLAEAQPDFARAAALFSPAVVDPDPVFDDLGALARLPLGIWCGDDDPFVDGVRQLVDGLDVPPDVLTYAPGAHTRAFWNDHTLDAFAWMAALL
ncbi:alpha/beta hydrolase [Nocardioides sp.]|uniref:alpha/beta hydrolase n=1 Tax=Nocardioides sp. TaxID=35761 RepID=UPI003D09DE1E